MNGLTNMTTTNMTKPTKPNRRRAAPKLPNSKAPDPTPTPVFQGTREEWGDRILTHLSGELLKLTPVITWNKGTRDWRVSLAPLPRGTLGKCYRADKSADGKTNQIVLSTDQHEPIELVHTLVHELLHAYDDCQSGHKKTGRWRRWADQIGIEWNNHKRGPIAERLVQDALHHVGTPGAHVPTRPAPRKSINSQVRFTCPSCQRYAHVAAGLASTGWKIGCEPCGMYLQPREST